MKKANILLILNLFLHFTAFSQDTIRVTEGYNHLSAAIDSASDNSLILLTSEGGYYSDSIMLTIDKPLSIEASPELKSSPVLTTFYSECCIRVKTDLLLKGVIIEGTNDTCTVNRGIVLDSLGYTLQIEGCVFRNFNDSIQTGVAISNCKYQGMPDSVLINNCQFSTITSSGIVLNAFGDNTIKNLSIANSTFSDIPGIPVYVSGTSESGNAGIQCLQIDHCTVSSKPASKAIVAENIDRISVKNSIVYSPEPGLSDAISLSGNNVVLKNMINFNTGISISNGQISNCRGIDPLFMEVELGNFILFDDSPAIGAGDDGSVLGDPRWGISSYRSYDLQFVKTPYSLSPTTESVRIMWETPERKSTLGLVEYGYTEELGETAVVDDRQFIEGEGYIHEVTIGGLEPFTEVFFRVSDGIRKSAKTYRTKTAPLKGTDFRIMTVSDTHENMGKIWETISSRAILDTLDLTVFLGDCVNNSNLRTGWDNGFFIPGEPLLSICPAFHILGNHDTDHGPTTYYDYFSLPVHPENGDDPEAYYSADYGDVKIIAVNLTENDYSPTFYEGSPQLAWMEEELENCNSKWIFFLTHVNILSTAVHSEESEKSKIYVLPLLEKCAAEGKHILVLSGHEHNFEHLYKNGVNYIRAGAANVFLRDSYTLPDVPYSLAFEKLPFYSTFDVRDSGEVVIFHARDTSGTVFYSARFDARENFKPTFFLTEPDGYNDSTNTSFNITWLDSDPDNNASIRLYYSPDSLLAENGVLITDTLEEDSSDNYFEWDTGNISPGAYYICAIVTDSINPPDTIFSGGKITVLPDSLALPSALNLQGSFIDNAILLQWENPYGSIEVDSVLADFEDGLDGFVATSAGTIISPYGRPVALDSLRIDTTETSPSLEINYKIASEGGIYAGIQIFEGFPNFSFARQLHFSYKGDGSENTFQVIMRQDNDRNGRAEDFWCSDTLYLSSTEWQEIVLSLDYLQPYPEHLNYDKVFDRENMATLDFVITAPVPDSGFIVLDDVILTGEMPSFPDFYGVGLFRNEKHFPDFWDDGEQIYIGNAETCIDAAVEPGHIYFYTLFARDYAFNISDPDISAIWDSGFIVGNEQVVVGKETFLDQNYPNPFSQTTTIGFYLAEPGNVKIGLYGVTGQKLVTLTDGFFTAGEHSLIVDPVELNIHSSGAYLYRMETVNGSCFRKCFFVKE